MVSDIKLFEPVFVCATLLTIGDIVMLLYSLNGLLNSVKLNAAFVISETRKKCCAPPNTSVLFSRSCRFLVDDADIFTGISSAIIANEVPTYQVIARFDFFTD